MQPVSIDGVRLDVGDVQVVVVQDGDVQIRRENGGHERDAVARVHEEVALQAVEQVAHGRRAALGGEQVVGGRGRVAVVQGLHQVTVDDLLGVAQDAVGHGVLVSDDAAGPLVHEFVAGQALSVQVIPGALEELRRLLAPVLVKEGEETRGGALGGGHARQVEVRLVHGAARLFQGKGAQQEEGLAGQGGNPVRVAASSVQEGARGALVSLLRHLHQEVLHLEGRHGPE